jgi:uncharacterized protein YciI
MHTSLASGVLASVLCACAAQPGPTAPRNAPPEPVQLAGESLPQGMRVYTLVLLRRGPTWTAEQTPESIELGKGHMAHIRRMAAAGKLETAGPFLGQTDSNDLAGVYIFGVTDVDEVRRLTAQDPAVAAGRFVPEYLIWLGPDNLVPDLEVPADSPEPPDSPQPAAGSEDPGSS